MGLLLIFAMPLLLGCGSDSGSDGGDDARLHGTWTYERVVNAGKESPAELLNRAPVVTFDDNQMIRQKGDEVVDSWSYKTDAAQDPKRITITMGEPGKEKDYHHYYTIEGDTLTMCHANDTFSNPFNIQLEPDAYFTVYRRAKE